MRAFVVGNGPSLLKTPLDEMKNEVCFAVNRINLIYEHTQWRPKYYVRAESMEDMDPNTWIDDVLLHLNMDGVITYCNLWFVKWLERYGKMWTQPANIIKGCEHYTRNFNSPEAPYMWHLPILCTYGSSVNVAIQLAVLEGYSPIYLVGCDLGYKDKQPSHFDVNYENGKERDARIANLDALNAHMIAARSSPVPIYNATIGGELEVYPRVDLCDVL